MRTLLLVDDDEFLLEAVSQLLTHRGFTVIAENDSTKALQRLSEGEDIALLVSDFDMPRCNGVQLATAAKQRNPPIPVVILSGKLPPEHDSPPWDQWIPKSRPISALITDLRALLAS